MPGPCLQSIGRAGLSRGGWLRGFPQGQASACPVSWSHWTSVSLGWVKPKPLNSCPSRSSRWERIVDHSNAWVGTLPDPGALVPTNSS